MTVQVVEELTREFDSFKRRQDQKATELAGKLDEIAEGVKATATVKGDVEALRERLELIEARDERPKANGSYSKEDSEHKGVFIDWIRNPRDAVHTNRLTECQHELGRKDVTIGSNPGGGFALPKQIDAAIESRVRQLNPFRGLVNVQQSSTNDFHSLVSLGDGTAGWVGETTTRTGTATPNLRDRQPTMGELYAYPTASNWSLQDLFFNVEQWLVDDISAEFASLEATAIISGNGTNRPTGFLNTTPVTTSDDASPMRNADAIQYIGLTGPSSPTSINIDSLIDLVGTMKERYLQEADRVAFVMHRTTAARLRKLKASTAGSYHWEPSTQAGQPGMLLGYPVLTCDAMPQVANDNFAVAFGNWRRGYLLVDRTGMQITVDQVTTPGQTKFYVRRRVGGRILNNDAIKALRISD